MSDSGPPQATPGHDANPGAGPAGARPSRYEPPSVRAAQSRQTQQFVLLVVRLLFLVLLVTVTVLTVASKRETDPLELSRILQLFGASIAVGVIVVLVDVLTPHKRLSSVFGVYLGLCAGLIGALAIGTVIDVVTTAWQIAGGPASAYVNLAKVLIAITLCYLAVSVVLTTKDDFRLVIPYVEFSKQVRGVRPMLLDTSALIDGRVSGLGETGLLDAPLVVPSFVIDELQTLADSGDKLKRERGRRGLSMVSKLQSSPFVDISIDDTKVEGRSVDHMLLDLALQQNMRVLTTDYNLSKVGQIRGVAVLNLNDLANTLKTQVVPGETLHVEIVKAGEAAGQGVGYLPDGTMIVVEGAADHIGSEVVALVTNSLQTSAGRLIFAKLPGAGGGAEAGASGAGAESRDSGARLEQMARSATTQPRTPVRSASGTGSSISPGMSPPGDATDPRESAASRRNPRR